MSHLQLIEDLKSSRETALNALNEIFTKVAKCKTNSKSKSSSSYNGMHAVCMAIKDNGQHYQIYAEAIEKLASDVEEQHWNMFVELLRFILGEFYKKKLFELTDPLAILVKADRITTPADIKSHLKLFSRHLFYCHTYLTEHQIINIFKSITQILVKCKQMEFEDLLKDFHNEFLGFPSMLQNVLAKHLPNLSPVFDQLFSAINTLKISKNKLNDSFLILSKYLIHFIYLDITDKNTVLSQNFLKSCKDNQAFKESKYQSYALNLLYYFVKLLLFPNTLDFNKNFCEIIGKMTTFFDRTELTSEPWFMDTIVTLARILDAYKSQKQFLQALNEESHKQAYSFFEKLVKLAHAINYESGLWTCCNSVRKHIIFKLCLVQLTMFESAVENNFTDNSLSSSVYTILKHTIAVAEFFKCSTVTHEIAYIMNALTRCAQNVKSKEHSEHLAKMLLLTPKAKEHLPENSVRILTKCLIHLHKVSGNSQGQAEACALYIAHLLESNGDSELIRKYITIYYSLEPCVCILEILDQSSFSLKPERYNRRTLFSMEAALRTNNILVVTSLLKSSETLIDFLLVTRQCPQVNVSAKLERKHAELKRKPDLTPLDHLALGHICKIQAVQQMNGLKNIFSIPKVTDESLPQISDLSKLKQMDISSEMQIMKLAFNGVQSFAKFFEFASQKRISDNDFFVDWEAIIDDVAMLARLFHLRGYIDYAYDSWHLLLQITSHIDDILNRIRAMSFICDECLFVEQYDPKLNIENEIRAIENGIFESLMSLKFLTPRRQNYVLICLCYISWYWAQKNNFQESQLLLDLALEQVEGLSERQNKFELVKATHLAVTFRIKWKLQKELSNRMAFAHVDKILDEVRAVVYHTSEDCINFPTLLCSVVNDVTEFTTNRLAEPATIPYVQMMMKLSLETGAAFRSVQFLMLWTHINLQSENVTKCQTKLDLIDILFGNAQTPKPSIKPNLDVKLKIDIDNFVPENHHLYDGEHVRKAVYVNPVSPVRIKYKATASQSDLETFLINHEPSCHCDKCSHPFLSWQFFKIGCLNARLLYLGDAFEESENFYAKALKWSCKNIHKSYAKYYFKEYEISMLIQYINLLRRRHNFKTASIVNEASLAVYDNFKNSLDGAYHVNLLLQLESITSANQKNQIKIKSTTRRILKFSPSDPKPCQEPVTTKRRGRPKKESPKTIRENIETIIYKPLTTTPAVKTTRSKDEGKSSRRKQKEIEIIEDVCKSVEEIILNDDPPKKSSTSNRRCAKQNLNIAIVVIDDDDSPPPSASGCPIPKSASKVESTPKTRGRPKKIPPATIAVAKSGEMEARRKALLRRRI